MQRAWCQSLTAPHYTGLFLYMKKISNEKMVIVQDEKGFVCCVGCQSNINVKRTRNLDNENKPIAGSTYFLQNDLSVQFITKI